MKHILDRIVVRGEKYPQFIKIYKKVYNDLLEKYICNKPKVKDLQNLFSDLKYNVNDNLETHLKIQSTFEIFNALEENDRS